MTTTIYTYGFRGYELKVDSHIKTRIVFAIVDKKKTRLAWYMFSQGMVVPAWHRLFEEVSAGKRKMDRPPTIFASAPRVSPSPEAFHFKFDIGDLAPRLGELTLGEAKALLDLYDDKAFDTTNCTLYIDYLDGPAVKSKRSILLNFDLHTERKRSTFDIKKTGRVSLIGIERFSPQALERGPTSAIWYMPQTNPDLPAW